MAQSQEATEHTTGTREEWRAAREELAKLEQEQAERNQEIKKKRRELPWVPVEKDYEFDTQDGRKTPGRRVSGLHEPRRRARGLSGPHQPSRRDADLLLARADRPAYRL